MSRVFGISYPFRKQGRGLPAAAAGHDAIRSALIVLLKTPLRSRVMRPDLGVELYGLLFEDVGPITAEILRDQIAGSIAKHVPQVRLVDIAVDYADKKFTVNVRYSIQGVLDETGNVELRP